MTVDNNRRALIVGLGKSGFAAANLLASQKMQISTYDAKAEESFSKEDIAQLRDKGITCFFGQEPLNLAFDIVVMSPGISPLIPMVEKARALGAEIIGELELAYRNCKGSFVAITGTNGKTTTTALVGEMFCNAGMSYEVVGNIGLPVTQRAQAASLDTAMITEVSSFQLETIVEFHPRVSAILNITPDHLDRHGSMEEYMRAKARIFENQDKNDFFVYNADDSLCQEIASACKTAKRVPFSRIKELDFGVFVEAGSVVIKTECGNKSNIRVCDVSKILIPGNHNLENALAAVAVSHFAGVETEYIQKALISFKGVEHRIEFVCEVAGVRYVNDSKGTNPDASQKAIQATNTPILLIAGGYEKNSDFDGFVQSFDGKVKYLLLLGVTAPRIAESAIRLGFPQNAIIKCESMRECVSKGAELAVPGDTVLLSPASASWGMYANYEERGKDFKNLALLLAEQDKKNRKG